MMQAVVANLPKKTGKSLQQWIAILKKDGPSDSKEKVAWLKSVHKLGHVTAQIVVANAEGHGDIYDDADKLVDDLFGAGKLKKTYEAVVKAVKPLAGTKIRPCKTYVPFSSRRQYALAKPAAGGSRIDLQLSLGKDAPADERLARLKSRDVRMSHVVALSDPDDVDAKVKRWLKQAYDEAS
jgi:hypothetical protein